MAKKVVQNFQTKEITVIELTQDEIAQAQSNAIEEAWKTLRNERDKLLLSSDWIVAKSYEASEPVPEIWIDYRQALRDLPANTQDPFNPVWPNEPI
jgi:hypothetical protein